MDGFVTYCEGCECFEKFPDPVTGAGNSNKLDFLYTCKCGFRVERKFLGKNISGPRFTYVSFECDPFEQQAKEKLRGMIPAHMAMVDFLALMVITPLNAYNLKLPLRGRRKITDYVNAEGYVKRRVEKLAEEDNYYHSFN